MSQSDRIDGTLRLTLEPERIHDLKARPITVWTVRLSWDSRVMLDAWAGSVDSVGELVGAAAASAAQQIARAQL